MRALPSLIYRFRDTSPTTQRAESIIAFGRLVIVLFAALAIHADPLMSSSATLRTALAIGIVGSAAIVFADWPHFARSQQILVWGGFVFDALVPATLIAMSGGIRGPLYQLSVFPIAVAAYRSMVFGGLSCAAWVLGLVVVADALHLFGENASYLWNLESTPTMRAGATLVMAFALGFLSDAASRRRRHLIGISPLRRTSAHDLRSLLVEDLEAARSAFKARRVVLIYEDPDEPYVVVAQYADGQLTLTQEAPDKYRDIVHPSLQRQDFILDNGGDQSSLLISSAAKTRHQLISAPVHQELTRLVGAHQMLCALVHGNVMEGRLFIDSRRPLVLDDLALARTLTAQLAGRLDVHLLSRRLYAVATAAERERMSRELHDGVVQSLTAARLSVRMARETFQKDPTGATELLLTTERLLKAEQGELYAYVHELEATNSQPSHLKSLLLSEHLKRLSQFLSIVWNVTVTTTVDPALDQDDSLGVHDLVRLVQESVANAARHGPATKVHVTVSRNHEGVQLRVADNGKGFPRNGHFDHETLSANGFGPRKLKNRIRELNGRLTLDSTPAGSTLLMTIPTLFTVASHADLPRDS